MKSDRTSSSFALLIEIKLEYTGLHGKFGLLFALRSEKADSVQSCKLGRAFRVGLGPKVDKNLGLNSGLRRAFVLGAQKYNQNNLIDSIAKFFKPNLTFVFFGHDLGFKLVFGFGPGLGLNCRVRA